MSSIPSAWPSQMAVMRDRWSDVLAAPDPDLVPAWQRQATAMRVEQDRLRNEGQWRSGGRTLMRALGVHHHEVLMCRGLAWLLTPDGWHGLGPSVLDGLLAAVDAGPSGADTTVVVEEARGNTRADIVIRTGGHCVVIEAKVWAGEQEAQADRLASGWADENPRLVFLTRDRVVPGTARVSAGAWSAMSWRDVGDLVSAAIARHPHRAPGVDEYWATIEFYGGPRQ